MKKIPAYLLFLFFLCCFSLSCTQSSSSNKNVATSPEKKESAPNWSYSGESSPEHWEAIEKDAECGGKVQSPINIIEANAVEKIMNASVFDFHYSEQTKIHNVKNNGHSIQYNFDAGDYLHFEKKRFDLKQFHFHEPSEHTINGVRYPLEIHLVHQNSQKEYLVLSFMAIEGATSPTFTFLESYLPLKMGESKPIEATFDFMEILANKQESFHYMGSLTTPPCTEGVNWFIFKTPITVSETQVKQLQALMPMNNYRNTQPLNGRVVEIIR